MRPKLEPIEDRILLSAAGANLLPMATVASPPAWPSVAAVISYVESTLDQVMVAVQQDVSTIGQAWAQVENYLVQPWDNLRGIPSAPNPVASNTGQQTGSGSGSGAMPAQSIFPRQGGPKVHPPSSGKGSGSDAGPYSGNNPATVSGEVWLDNNGDNSLDDGEMGYSGAQVNLINVSAGGTQSTVTDANGNYKFTVGDYLPANYQIRVIFPYGCFAALQTSQSQIDANGYSQVFTLGPGGSQTIWGGIQSLNVTTTQDDASNNPSQNQITLRDAMETGNNGAGQDQNRNPLTITFVNPSNQQPVTGTINLQATLPDIAASYNIDGPGASSLAVNGGGNAGTIFTIDAGVGSTISGLTAEGGSSSDGGGVKNSGNLKLIQDVIQGNTSTGNAGGIDNGKGTATLSGCQILGNSAGVSGGGIYNNGGTLTIVAGTVIKSNKAPDTTVGHGGGIYNASSGKVTVSGGSVISTNSAGLSGGGVDNLATFSMTGGQISNNTVPPTTGGGGGVDNVGSLKLLGVQVQKNSAGQGGGIFTASGPFLLAQNTTISNNKASSNGAGIFVQSGTGNMVGGGVTYNTAQQDGGGIYVRGGQLGLSSVQVSGNNAIGGSVTWGGGIFIKTGKATVSGGTIGSNQAGSSGGGIYNFAGTLTLQESVSILANEASNQGGGAYLAKSSTTTFNGVTVKNNETYGNQPTTGWGVYQQIGATIIPPVNLTDNDDPNGKPYQGP